MATSAKTEAHTQTTEYAPAITPGHFNFLTLLLTTPASAFLLYCTVNDVRFDGGFFDLITQNRPVVQFAVQIIANLLSFCQILVICRLINLAVRRHIADHSMGLNTIRAWTNAMVPHMNWDLPAKLWTPLMLFLLASMALRGIWAAALTPVALWKEVEVEVVVPSWANISNVKEYPSEIGRSGPVLQNTMGRFAYSVGMQLLGNLLSTAATATPIDGRSRQHTKIDRSRYTYIGRSYGAGSGAGLVDEAMESNGHALSYTFQEDTYRTVVNCIYNSSSEFLIRELFDTNLYAAEGPLPDSDDGEEYSEYVSHDGSNIVAIGVAHFAEAEAEELPLRRYLAFAAGESYDFLDKIQCEVDFLPTKCQVDVSVGDRNITVQPLDTADVEDIDPSRRLKGSLLRQFELIANDETNLYLSMVGSAFNASITDLKTYRSSLQDSDVKLDSSEIALEAVSNSITAMTDDMLGAYAAAQLLIGDFTQTTTGTLRISAIYMGDFRFALAVFIINIAVIAAVIAEAARTRWWVRLPRFDMSDLRQVAVAASTGGDGLGRLSYGKVMDQIGKLRIKYQSVPGGGYAILATDKDIGEFGTSQHPDGSDGGWI